MNNTNWPDVCIVLMWCLTILAGLGISAKLAIEGHPWFALLTMLIIGSLRIKTGI